MSPAVGWPSSVVSVARSPISIPPNVKVWPVVLEPEACRLSITQWRGPLSLATWDPNSRFTSSSVRAAHRIAGHALYPSVLYTDVNTVEPSVTDGITSQYRTSRSGGSFRAPSVSAAPDGPAAP